MHSSDLVYVIYYVNPVCIFACCNEKTILIQAMPCFYGELLPIGIFSKPMPLR